MAGKNNDGDYLDSLINSVSGTMNKNDNWIDEEFSQDMEEEFFNNVNFDDLNFDEELSDKLDNSSESSKSSDTPDDLEDNITSKEQSYILSDDTDSEIQENENQTADSKTEGNENQTVNLETLENENQTADSETLGNENQTVNLETLENENQTTESETLENENQTADSENQEYDNQMIDISDDVFKDDDDELNEIMNALNDIDNSSDNKSNDSDIFSDSEKEINNNNLPENGINNNNENTLENNVSKVNNDNNVSSEEQPLEDNLMDLITSENKIEKKSKKKKKGFLSKLFSKNKTQDSKSDLTDIDTDNILDETGSVSEDLESMGLNDYSFNSSFNNNSNDDSNDDLNDDLFNEIDILNNLEEHDNNKDKKKEKKNKKDKKDKKNKDKKDKKEKGAKEPKQKKEKKPKLPPLPSELVKITPVGIVLTLTIIAAFIIVLYFGGRQYNYFSAINDATEYYVDEEYTKAYALLAGMEIKSSDKAFYNQIVNIMRVEKHLNDFNSYYKLKRYDLALESLINGVKSYDKYVDDSRNLGTFDKLSESLANINESLTQYYGLTESDARTISQLNDKSQYQQQIYEKSKNVIIK